MNGGRGGLHEVILDCVADGVFTVDRDFKITSFNRAAEKITGVPREEAIGTPCKEVFRADICEDGCALRETLRTGRPIVNRPVRISGNAGERIPISVSTAVLRDGGGEVLGGVETFRDLTLVEAMRREILRKSDFHDIISTNPAMQELFAILPEMARSGSTILIEGQGGSGKELFARAIHDLSPRKDGPFVAVNCGAIPESLLAAELFGYVEGALAGAHKDRAGRIAAASNGTLFLDEVGELPPAVQARLLRVLEDRVYEPLGSSDSLRADVRVVAATSRDLEPMRLDGTFREDLYYRLNVIRLELPPLRRRREDIPLLVEHFIGRLARLRGKDVAGVDDEALGILMSHDWPGNVRELLNAVEFAFVVCPGGLIGEEHLPRELRTEASRAAARPTSLDEAEAKFLREILARNGGNRAATARALGIHKTTLWRKMKKLGVS